MMGDFIGVLHLYMSTVIHCTPILGLPTAIIMPLRQLTVIVELRGLLEVLVKLAAAVSDL